jgi:YfiH family protein
MAILQRTAHPGGIVTYRSLRLQALDIPHGFTTRLGGVSAPPYDSLDLSGSSPGAGAANRDAIAENTRRLHRALNCNGHRQIAVRQVHGAAVHVAHGAPSDLDPPVAADALVTSRPGLLLIIRVADCVPVLLSAPGGRSVAAVHAGWRGIIAGVLPAAVSALASAASCPSAAIIAAIGPCLSVDYFEVGPEVAQAFTGAGLSQVLRPSLHASPANAKPHIDLRAAARAQLERAGIPAQSIDESDRCTYRDQAEFFSHRRDRGTTGRMAAAIAAC